MPTWVPVSIIVAMLLVFVWWKFSDELKLRFNGLDAEGTIVNWMSLREKGVLYFHPIIEFSTENGEKISYRAEERCEDEPLYPQGTSVKIKYLKEKPKVVKTIYPNLD